MTTQGFPVVINAFASDFWMWGATLCRVYACIGGIFGVASIMTMVVIGYDRYNVIVKGFKGTKITFGKAAIILIFVWLYAALGCCPPFLGWPSNTARLGTGPLSSELCQKSVGCAHGVALKLGKAVTTAAKVLIYSTVHQSRYLYVYL